MAEMSDSDESPIFDNQIARMKKVYDTAIVENQLLKKELAQTKRELICSNNRVIQTGEQHMMAVEKFEECNTRNFQLQAENEAWQEKLSKALSDSATAKRKCEVLMGNLIKTRGKSAHQKTAEYNKTLLSLVLTKDSQLQRVQEDMKAEDTRLRLFKAELMDLKDSKAKLQKECALMQECLTEMNKTFGQARTIGQNLMNSYNAACLRNDVLTKRIAVFDRMCNDKDLEEKRRRNSILSNQINVATRELFERERMKQESAKPGCCIRFLLFICLFIVLISFHIYWHGALIPAWVHLKVTYDSLPPQ